MKTLPALPHQRNNSNESDHTSSPSAKPCATNLVESARMQLTLLDQQRVARRQSIAKLAQFALRITSSHSNNSNKYTPTSSQTNSPTPSFHSLLQYPIIPSPLRQSPTLPTVPSASSHHSRLYGVRDDEATATSHTRSNEWGEHSIISATRKQLDITSSPESSQVRVRFGGWNRCDSPSPSSSNGHNRSPSSRFAHSSSSSSSTSSPLATAHSLVSPLSLSRKAAHYDHCRTGAQSPPPPVNFAPIRAQAQSFGDF